MTIYWTIQSIPELNFVERDQRVALWRDFRRNGLYATWSERLLFLVLHFVSFMAFWFLARALDSAFGTGICILFVFMMLFGFIEDLIILNISRSRLSEWLRTYPPQKDSLLEDFDPAERRATAIKIYRALPYV